MVRLTGAVFVVAQSVSAWAQVPVPVSPGAADEVLQVAGHCPTFSWTPVLGAAGHRVVAYRVEEGEVEPVRLALSVDLPAGATSWTPPLRRCFDGGATYAWRVGAVRADGELDWSAPAWFEVASGGPLAPVDGRTLSTTVELPADGKEGGGSGTVGTRSAAPAASPRAVRAAPVALASYFSVGSTGNVTGNVFTGDGSGLTNLQAGNIDGLVAGGVTFGGAGLVQDAANFFWDDANNRLGLGTNAPAEQLDLSGNLRLRTAGAQIQLGSTRFLHNTGSMNTWVGEGAGRVSSTGYQNVAVGYQALSTEATTGFGYHNSAVGSHALASNSSGSANTAMGFWALKSNTTADNNAAFGESALQNNTSGADNTALGSYALMNTTTASRNTAVGISALQAQSYSNANSPYETDNTAVGAEALYSNQPSSSSNGLANTAVGSRSLRSNTSGSWNTAVGYQSLYGNSTGTLNTAVGANAGYGATGSGGVFIGQGAGFSEAASNRLHIANSSAKTLVYGEFNNERVVIADTTAGVAKGLDVNGYIRARAWATDATTRVCRNGNGVLGDCLQQQLGASEAAEAPPATEIHSLREQVAHQQALIAELARRLAVLEAAVSSRE